MTNTASKIVLACASLTWASCCGVAQDFQVGRQTRTHEDAARYLIVRDATSGAVIFDGPLSSLGVRTFAERSASRYVATVSTSFGFAILNAPVLTSKGFGEISLNRECVRVAGEVAPKVPPGTPVYFEPWTQGFAAFAAAADAAGQFHACLPAADYVVSVDLPGKSQVLARWDGQTGRHVLLSLYETASVRRPPESAGVEDARADIKDLVRDPKTKIVAVGESDHGSRSFLELRERVVLAMAATRPTTVAIEAGPAETIPLDQYISGEAVDVRRAVAHLGYWMWDTEEFLAMLANLRAYNAMFTSRRIAIVGADVQFAANAAQYLVDHREEAGMSERDVTLLSELRDEAAVGALDASTRAQLSEMLRPVASRGVDAFSSRDRVVLCALAIRGRLSMIDGVGFYLHAARDAGMAQIVLSLARGGGKQGVVFLAHNTHISAAATRSVPMAGWHIRRALGRSYHAIGVSSYSGVTRAYAPSEGSGVEPMALPVAPEGTAEAALSDNGTSFSDTQGNGLVVLRRTSARFHEWLRTPRSMRDFGPVYPGDDSSWVDVPLLEAFDSVAILQSVAPTTPTTTGRRPARVPSTPSTPPPEE